MPVRKYHLIQVDVFTERLFGGNPLAVFPSGEGLSDGEMQAIAQEMNLSETVFVLPSTRSDCASRLRIFTPSRELSFAGHPTIGSAVLDVPALTERHVDPSALGVFVFAPIGA